MITDPGSLGMTGRLVESPGKFGLACLMALPDVLAACLQGGQVRAQGFLPAFLGIGIARSTTKTRITGKAPWRRKITACLPGRTSVGTSKRNPGKRFARELANCLRQLDFRHKKRGACRCPGTGERQHRVGIITSGALPIVAPGTVELERTE